jgi:hypothetical protein
LAAREEVKMRSALDGTEGGSWVVTTANSHHEFDLDAMTVTRIPGPGAPATVNDRTRPILEIVRCEVGERGLWLLIPEGAEGDNFGFFWHLSTEIRSIDPAPSRQAP